jgi:hypothetical protein
MASFVIPASGRECSARYLLEGIVRRHLGSVSIAEQADQAGKILPRFSAIEGGQIVVADCLHIRKDAHRCRCRRTA